jgi:hypothetical protein
VIDEAARLLCGLPLATERGASARGERVHVIVDPQWDEAAGSYRVAVLCHAPAVDDPGWSGLPVLLERKRAQPVPAAPGTVETIVPAAAPFGSAGAVPAAPRAAARAMAPAAAPQAARVTEPVRLALVARLDARGFAEVPGVPAGEYRLLAGAAWVQLRGPIVLPAKGSTADGRLTVSLQRRAAAVGLQVDYLHVQRPRVTARFSFFDRDGRELHGGEVGLQVPPGGGPATGRWEGDVALDGVDGFACQIVRDDDRPGATI